MSRNTTIIPPPQVQSPEDNDKGGARWQMTYEAEKTNQQTWKWSKGKNTTPQNSTKQDKDQPCNTFSNHDKGSEQPCITEIKWGKITLGVGKNGMRNEIVLDTDVILYPKEKGYSKWEWNKVDNLCEQCTEAHLKDGKTEHKFSSSTNTERSVKRDNGGVRFQEIENYLTDYPEATFLVSTGQNGLLGIHLTSFEEGLKHHLPKKAGQKIILGSTPDLAVQYEELRSKGEAVVFFAHLTC